MKKDGWREDKRISGSKGRWLEEKMTIFGK